MATRRKESQSDFLAVRCVAHLEEQRLAKPRPLDGLEELLWDDHVGVDIDHVEGRGDAGQGSELFHAACLS